MLTLNSEPEKFCYVANTHRAAGLSIASRIMTMWCVCVRLLSPPTVFIECFSISAGEIMRFWPQSGKKHTRFLLSVCLRERERVREKPDAMTSHYPMRVTG